MTKSRRFSKRKSQALNNPFMARRYRTLPLSFHSFLLWLLVLVAPTRHTFCIGMIPRRFLLQCGLSRRAVHMLHGRIPPLLKMEASMAVMNLHQQVRSVCDIAWDSLSLMSTVGTLLDLVPGKSNLGVDKYNVQTSKNLLKDLEEDQGHILSLPTFANVSKQKVGTRNNGGRLKTGVRQSKMVMVSSKKEKTNGRFMSSITPKHQRDTSGENKPGFWQTQTTASAKKARKRNTVEQKILTHNSATKPEEMWGITRFLIPDKYKQTYPPVPGRPLSALTKATGSSRLDRTTRRQM